MENDPIKRIEDLTKDVHEKIEKRGQSVFARYPMLFSLLGTFGLAMTLYGIEGVVEKIPFFSGRPFLILLVGIVLLVLTGSLYKRLGK